MTTYERLMKEAKEQYEKEMQEKKNKLKVKHVLDAMGLKDK